MLALAAAALMGCSRAPEHTPEPASPTPNVTSEPQAVQGGTLRLPMPENISLSDGGYDPLLVTTEEMYQLFSLVYDPLIAVDTSNMLTPSLVQSWTPYTNDGKWMLKLRSGVTWHDGSPFTADDVIYTFNQIREIRDGYYSDAAKNISDMYKQDDLTLIVASNSVGLSALYSLNFPVKKADSDAVMLGTGAYRVDKVSDERIVLKVNTVWWEKTPNIATVEFLARGSNDLAIASYEADMLDFVSTSQLAVGQYASAGETIVADCMTQQMETLLINHTNGLLADKRFRSALAHLIDRSSIITNVYLNKARSSDVPFPPDSWLYDSSQVVFDYNIDTALKLLAECGCTWDEDGKLIKDGSAVTLRLLCGSTTDNSVRADAAAMIADNLRGAGIDVQLINLEHDLNKEDNPFLTALSGGDWDLAAVGFNLSESNDLSKFLLTNGRNNFGGYSDSRIDSLVALMNRAGSETAMRERAYELQAAFTEEMPFIVLYFRLSSVIYSARINGIETLREPGLMRDIRKWYYVK